MSDTELEKQHQREFEEKYGKSSLFGKGGATFFILFVFSGAILGGTIFYSLIVYNASFWIYIMITIIFSGIVSYIVVNYG